VSPFAEAIKAFTRALEHDPNMATGYMNRGYVWNDLRMATNAEEDFRKALTLRPNYGEAHLGLAYSLLQLRRPQVALKEADLAEKSLGESGTIYLARAEAYRQRSMLDKACSGARFCSNCGQPVGVATLAEDERRHAQGFAGRLPSEGSHRGSG